MVKKKFWRCYVCNDIHWGTVPPDICPTCKVRHAYVEISVAEARLILGHGPEGTFSEEDFRRSIEAFAAPNEFQVNPVEERTATLIKGVFENERNHGLKYCPCRLITKDFEEDLKLVCPCNFPTHETYKGLPNGECWCGLFVRRKA